MTLLPYLIDYGTIKGSFALRIKCNYCTIFINLLRMTAIGNDSKFNNREFVSVYV